MQKSLNPSQYIQQLGLDLIEELSQSAKPSLPTSLSTLAENPHAPKRENMLPAKKENPVWKKLKGILPPGIGIASGYIIDSFGNSTDFCNFILYEEAATLRFYQTEDDAKAIFNCEGIVAVGEIAGDAEPHIVSEAVKRLRMVKRLKRYTRNWYESRYYLPRILSGVPVTGQRDPYDQQTKPLDQIFTFFLCNNFTTDMDEVIRAIYNGCENPKEYPNRLLSAAGDYLWYGAMEMDSEENAFKATSKFSPIDANYFMISRFKMPFNQLMYELSMFLKYARTVPLENYIYMGDQEQVGYTSMPLTPNDPDAETE